MADPHISTFQKDVEKTLQFLQTEYSKLQTGRANPALVEHVEVDAYGQRQPLKSVASISVQDARTISVQPWDKSIMQNVEKALQQANLGTNPVNDGVAIRINLPPLTEERRKELQKVAHKLAEEARIIIRQQRQGVHDALKQEKNETYRDQLLKELQKHVDEANKKIDEIRKKKEEELLKI